MKTTAAITTIIAAFAFAGAALAADDHWTYNSGAGTITDSEWTFNATLDSNNKMTVGTCTVYPSSLSTLDFAKPVQDAGGTQYTIKTLNTAMVTFSVTGGKPETSTDKGMAAKVGELRLPATGLTTIGEGAFCRTVYCTNVVNYLPDTVTGIGNSAFAYCGAEQDLFLRGFSGTTGRGIFYHAGIKSITFGPGFKGIGDTSNKMASFQGCSGITNVVFDPAGSGITLTANAFRCKAKLTQPLILYGVKSVSNSALDSWQIPSVTFDVGIERVGTFTNVTALAEVRFLGGPPTAESGAWANYSFPLNHSTITTYISRKFDKHGEWSAYAADNKIGMHNSTFSSTYASEPEKRPLLYIDKMAGYYITFR